MVAPKAIRKDGLAQGVAVLGEKETCKPLSPQSPLVVRGSPCVPMTTGTGNYKIIQKVICLRSCILSGLQSL